MPNATQPYRRAAVLGSPIAHSLSPLIHSTAYRVLGLEGWTYEACDVKESQLAEFIDSRDTSWAGLSLTMPLKQTIMDMGEPKNYWAEKLGVGNTAIFTWSAHSRHPHIDIYNTDVAGIYMALQYATGKRDTVHGTDCHSRHASAPIRANISSFGHCQPSALVIGSGNTAHSAIAALSTLGCGSVTVAARNIQKAYALVPLAQHLGMSTRVVAPSQLATIVSEEAMFDYVICTLPPHAADQLADQLREALVRTGRVLGTGHYADGASVLLDVAYVPHPTALIRVWQEFGGLAVGGEEMLLYQALPQIAYMTGIALDQFPAHLPSTIRQALAAQLSCSGNIS